MPKGSLSLSRQHAVALLLPLLLAHLIGPAAAFAAENLVHQVTTGKKATALVDLRSLGSGTAFCVHPRGYFLTNWHVVKDVSRSTDITLVINPSETDEKVLSARVLRADKDADLALLYVARPPVPLTALPIGDDKDLIETMPLMAFGYPFGKALAEQYQYPSISVTTGRITSLRKEKGQLRLIQVDASLNPGNSGGPMVDDQGLVRGVVVAGIQGAALNFALPASRVRTFLRTPHIEFSPPKLTAANLTDKQEFLARIVTPRLDAVEDYTVELTLQIGDAEPVVTRLAAEAAAQGVRTYRLELAPLSRRPTSERRMRVTADFPDGRLVGFLDSGKFVIGKTEMTLSEISHIRNGPIPQVTLANGAIVSGPLRGLEVKIDVGGQTITTDLAACSEVTLDMPQQRLGTVNYVLTVRLGKDELARQEGRIALRQDQPATRPHVAEPTRPAALKPTTLPVAEATLKFPRKVRSMVVAGSGRFLLLGVEGSKEMNVVDVNQAAIVRKVPLPSDDALIAASADQFFIAVPDQRLIERWSLTTFQREHVVTLNVEGRIYELVCGSASEHGPLLVYSGMEEVNRHALRAVDPKTLAVIGGPIERLSLRPPRHIRAAAQGDVFTIGCGGALGLLVFRDGRLLLALDPDDVNNRVAFRIPVPSPDGRLIFTDSGGIHKANGQRVGGKQGWPLFPAAEPCAYYFIPHTHKESPGRLFVPEHDQPLLNSLKFPEMLKHVAHWPRNPIELDQRYVLLPTARLLITLPPENDRLVLRQFDPVAAIKATGKEYLFVSSAAPRSARRGSQYTYAMAVHSSQTGLTYHVEEGPNNVTIDDQGVLTWHVPDRFAQDIAQFKVAIQDRTGQRVVHVFDVQVSN